MEELASAPGRARRPLIFNDFDAVRMRPQGDAICQKSQPIQTRVRLSWELRKCTLPGAALAHRAESGVLVRAPGFYFLHHQIQQNEPDKRQRD